MGGLDAGGDDRWYRGAAGFYHRELIEHEGSRQLADRISKASCPRLSALVILRDWPGVSFGGRPIRLALRKLLRPEAD